MTPTPVAKDYLVTIATLADEGRPVIAARLAERLKVTAPTVHQTLQRLTRDGLVRLEARRGITLTPEGRRLAEEAMRRQGLSERWLVEMLGVDWPEARQAARTMEPAITDRIEARLDAVLGHPGAAMADARADAAPEAMPMIPLDHAEAGSVVVLERIVEDVEHGPELLRYLDGQGLRPGARLTVASVEPWAHTVTLRRGDDQIVLGTRVAAQLWVRSLTIDELARSVGSTATECPEDEHFVAEVRAVESACPAGHQVGDRFTFAQRTPCGMCGEAFVEMYPRLAEVRSRTAVADPDPVVVACPEHGNVEFEVRLTSR